MVPGATAKENADENGLQFRLYLLNIGEWKL